MSIHFHYQKAILIRDVRKIKHFVSGLIQEEEHLLERLEYIFCSDEYLLKINQDFLSHDDFTDVISFSFSEDPLVINGEIYISVERVRDNALQFSTSFRKELLRVIFHGVLHLCGYLDKMPSEQILMREKENYYLDKYFS